MPVGQIADRLQVRNDPVHREDAVGRDQLEAGAGRFRFVQPGFEVGHVVVAVAKALRLAQADAVDDAGVIQFVADDGVLFAEQRFEHAAVGIEAARIEDAVVGSEERGNRPLELLVHGLRAANEAHRRHAEAPVLEPLARRRDQPRVVGQAQIVVRAEIEHLGARAQHDLRRLRAFDHPLRLVEPVGTDRIDGAAQVRQVFVMHRGKVAVVSAYSRDRLRRSKRLGRDTRRSAQPTAKRRCSGSVGLAFSGAAATRSS